MTTCRCGHDLQAHRHYRRGNDCSLCGCRRLRRRWPGWLLGALRAVGVADA